MFGGGGCSGAGPLQRVSNRSVVWLEMEELERMSCKAFIPHRNHQLTVSNIFQETVFVHVKQFEKNKTIAFYPQSPKSACPLHPQHAVCSPTCHRDAQPPQSRHRDPISRTSYGFHGVLYPDREYRPKASKSDYSR